MSDYAILIAVAAIAGQTISTVVGLKCYLKLSRSAIHAAVAQTPGEYVMMEKIAVKPPKVKGPKPEPVYPYGL